MPKADPLTAVAPAPAQAMQFSESIKLDEKYRKNFNKQKDDTKELMQSNLRTMYAGMRKQIESKYNAASANDKIKVALDVAAPGVAAYRDALKKHISQISWESIQAARKQVPSKKNIKLVESIDTVKLADSFGYYDALPTAVKKLVQTQAELIATTQAADLEKTVLFQYTTSAGAELPLAEILNDMDERIDGVLTSGVGAGMNLEAAASNVLANAFNQAQLTFFFEPEVLDEIESFTFTNEDPVSDICQELNGTTFDVGDPDLSKFQPPLHHNAVLTGTLIDTIIGKMTIENVTKGMLVKTHTGKFKEITEWMDRFEDKEYFTITLDNGKTIDITAEHPVLTSTGWKRVDELILSDNILCLEDLPNGINAT